MKKIVSITALAILALPLLANAQGGIRTIIPPNTVDIPSLVIRIFGWAFGLLLVIAALFILWAAYLFLTGGGSDESQKAAKKYILFAVIAIIVGALARGLIVIVRMLFNVP